MAVHQLTKEVKLNVYFNLFAQTMKTSRTLQVTEVTPGYSVTWLTTTNFAGPGTTCVDK